MRGETGCILTFFRTILNENSTGPCILASVFIRYCLICFPTSEILNDRRLKYFSAGLLLVILVEIVINLILMSSTYTILVFVQSSQISHQERFLWNCELYAMRNISAGKKVIWDILICFVIPVAISGFFYLRVSIALCQRERDEERNRNLVIAFVFNWILWILFWTFYYVILLVRSNFTYEEFEMRNSLQEVIAPFKENVALMYSHVNPLLFLIIFKPYQEINRKLFRLACMSSPESFGLIYDKTRNLQRPNQVKKLQGSPESKGALKKKIRTIASVYMVVSIGLIVFGLSSSINSNLETTKLHRLSSITESRIQGVGMRQLAKNSDNKDVLGLHIEDPRVYCSRWHGVFNSDLNLCSDNGMILHISKQFCSIYNIQ